MDYRDNKSEFARIACLLVVLGLAYLRGQENFRKTSRVLALLIAALVFFGVGARDQLLCWEFLSSKAGCKDAVFRNDLF